MNDWNKSQPIILKIDENELNFRTKNEKLDKTLSGNEVPDLVCIDSVHNIFKLSDLGTPPFLIYRYSERHCSSCYETELTSLQKYFPKNDHSVVILASYQDHRNFAIFVKAQSVGLPIYQIEHHRLDWNVEDYGVPYYFINKLTNGLGFLSLIRIIYL
ncbi:hypothetical protein AGMMS50239_12370 [Bacteroidia bacterium]|nr:hypothetical protein AGMMS50239_12370 [Bacteroidia bacterium]